MVCYTSFFSVIKYTMTLDASYNSLRMYGYIVRDDDAAEDVIWDSYKELSK